MDDRARHISAVLIAFLFGAAALVPTCSFTENLQSTAINEVHSSSTTVQFVFIPGLFFAVAVLLSGLAICRAGLLPAGISFSWLRIAGSSLFAIFVYPAAFAATVFGVMILFFAASADSSPWATGYTSRRRSTPIPPRSRMASLERWRKRDHSRSG